MKTKKTVLLLFSLFIFLIASLEAIEKLNKTTPYTRYLYPAAITAIFKNEAPFLKEWIEYHKLIGVKHFYLYNNNSTDGFREVLKPYLIRGEVDLIDWPFISNNQKEWTKVQCAAYNHAIQMAYGYAEWLAIIDIDEFIVPVTADNLAEFLRDYGDYAAVGINWQMFGTSGVSRIPSKSLMVETLLMKGPENFEENSQVKSIVRPEVVVEVINPHFAILHPGCLQVNPDKQAFSGAFAPAISTDKIQINHYWTRDEEYFYNFKVGRRENWDEQKKTSEKRLNSLNAVPDDKILRFVPLLRKQMGY